MMDENTNKIVWVIGAIAIATAIIFAAQLLFPQLFQNIMTTLQEFFDGLMSGVPGLPEGEAFSGFIGGFM